MTAGQLQTTDRTVLRRHSERGSFDRRQVYDILDAGMVCHVAWVEQGRPIVLPTAYGRSDDSLILHGAADGRFMKILSEQEVCITVTLLDGLVLAKSAFHSSMNYRSVVLFGTGEPILDRQEKLAALDVLVEHLAPQRTAEVRPTTEKELAATTVVRVPLREASAKVRIGPPIDAKADLELPIWSGVVPLEMHAGGPISDDGAKQLAIPASVLGLVGEKTQPIADESETLCC